MNDCLEEAMDLPRLTDILTRIHDGGIRCVARDTTEPSPLSHEIINARPYAFLDDAPLEERRAHAVQTRRSSDDKDTIALGVLDASAIAMARAEAWPDPRDPDELHDALVGAGFLTMGEVAREQAWRGWLDELSRTGRAAVASCASWGEGVWIAAERLPELQAGIDGAQFVPPISAPRDRANAEWTREAALMELVRGRMALAGPIAPRHLGAPLGFDHDASLQLLLALEVDGMVLRGWFSPGGVEEEWCDRRLLARIHRATLQRLRAEIRPVSQSDFMRFLFAWQHVEPSAQLTGLGGVRAVIDQLDGFELAADAWDRRILPARVKGYDPSMLDLLCYSGEAAWARLTRPPAVNPSAILPPRPVRATPIALFRREHAQSWRALAEHDEAGDAFISDIGREVLRVLAAKGARFVQDCRRADADPGLVRDALAELVWAGLVASDGFAGLRAIWSDSAVAPSECSGAADCRGRIAGRAMVVSHGSGEWGMGTGESRASRSRCRGRGVHGRAHATLRHHVPPLDGA